MQIDQKMRARNILMSTPLEALPNGGVAAIRLETARRRAHLP